MTRIDATGKYQTEAAMIKFADGKVHLKKRDGKAITVPPVELSKSDQEYVREELARRGAMQAKVASRSRNRVTSAGGMLYSFADSGGRITLVAPSATGAKATGAFKVAGQGNSLAYPVVTGGRLYVRYDTNLYCYNVKAK